MLLDFGGFGVGMGLARFAVNLIINLSIIARARGTLMTKMIVLSLVLTSLTSFAGTKEIRENQTKCMDDNGSTMGMVMCSGDALTLAETLMDKTVTRMKAMNMTSGALSKEERAEHVTFAKEINQRLVAAQKAFVAFRNAQCSLDATDMLGGSGERLVEVNCMSNMTLDRIEALEKSGQSSL